MNDLKWAIPLFPLPSTLCHFEMQRQNAMSKANATVNVLVLLNGILCGLWMHTLANKVILFITKHEH